MRVRAVDDIGRLLFGRTQQVLNARAETLVRGLVGLRSVLLELVETLVRLGGLGPRLLGFLLRRCERLLEPHQVSSDRIAVVAAHRDREGQVLVGHRFSSSLDLSHTTLAVRAYAYKATTGDPCALSPRLYADDSEEMT